jgi:hypothetical protein
MEPHGTETSILAIGALGGTLIGFNTSVSWAILGAIVGTAAGLCALAAIQDGVELADEILERRGIRMTGKY